MKKNKKHYDKYKKFDVVYADFGMRLGNMVLSWF